MMQQNLHSLMLLRTATTKYHEPAPPAEVLGKSAATSRLASLSSHRQVVDAILWQGHCDGLGISRIPLLLAYLLLQVHRRMCFATMQVTQAQQGSPGAYAEQAMLPRSTIAVVSTVQPHLCGLQHCLQPAMMAGTVRSPPSTAAPLLV